jgi:hypothetical protein
MMNDGSGAATAAPGDADINSGSLSNSSTQQRDSISSTGERSSVGSATAIDEVWQNQTYLPIKGWGAPFTSPSHFSDISGERRFGDDLPEYPPLEG